MLFLNERNLGPKFEAVTNYGLATAGLVIAIGKVGMVEVAHFRNRMKTAESGRNNLALSAVEQVSMEPDTEASIIHLPQPNEPEELRLSA
jgi:hypothetical protein